MELLKETKERSWYLVEEWTTKAGLKARVQKCVWSDEVKSIASSLHDFCTGYVQIPEGSVREWEKEMDVHGGITFGPDALDGESGLWIGFDMAHILDENIPDQEAYAHAECEKLAEQVCAPV